MGDPTGIAATRGKAARDPQQGQNPRQTVRGILRRRHPQTGTATRRRQRMTMRRKSERRHGTNGDGDRCRPRMTTRHRAEQRRGTRQERRHGGSGDTAGAATRHKRGRRPMQAEDDNATQGGTDKTASEKQNAPGRKNRRTRPFRKSTSVPDLRGIGHNRIG